MGCRVRCTNSYFRESSPLLARGKCQWGLWIFEVEGSWSCGEGCGLAWWLRRRVEFGGGGVLGRDFRPFAPLGVTEGGWGVVRRAHHERGRAHHERVWLTTLTTNECGSPRTGGLTTRGGSPRTGGAHHGRGISGFRLKAGTTVGLDRVVIFENRIIGRR